MAAGGSATVIERYASSGLTFSAVVVTTLRMGTDGTLQALWTAVDKRREIPAESTPPPLFVHTPMSLS